MSCHGWLAALVIALSLFPVPAEARRPGESSTTDAKALVLYNEAVKQYDLGDFDQSLQAFRAAYLLKPEARDLLGIAHCLRKLGKAEEALEAFRSYLRRDPNTPDKDKITEIIDSLEHELQAKNAPPPPPLLPPLKSVYEAPPPVAVANPIVATPPSRVRPAAPIAVGIGALALLGAGAGLLGSVGSSLGDLQNACAPACSPSEVDSLRVRAVTGYALLGAGAAAAAVDVVLWVLASRPREGQKRLTLVPMGSGLAIKGAF